MSFSANRQRMQFSLRKMALDVLVFENYWEFILLQSICNLLYRLQYEKRIGADCRTSLAKVRVRKCSSLHQVAYHFLSTEIMKNYLFYCH